MTMDKEESRPGAWCDRFCPKDFDFFAGILAVRQEFSLDNPAISISMRLSLDSRTADQHTHG